MDAIMNFLKEFDPAALLPDISSIVGIMQVFARILILIIPILLGGLGAAYYFKPIKEANHIFGYRTYFGMGSVEAWRFTQFLAGIVWSALGLILTVVMLLVCSGYRDMDAMDMVNSAITCVLWEIGTIAVCCLGINITALVVFDRNGNRRAKKKKR